MQIRTFPDGVTWVRWLCAQFDPTWGKPAATSLLERHCASCFADDARWRPIPELDPMPAAHLVYVCALCTEVTCVSRIVR